MQRNRMLKFGLLLCILSLHTIIHAQNPVNWTTDQLVQPADLAKTLQDGKNIPVIFSVGRKPYIPNSVNVDMVKEKENLNKLKVALKKLPKNQQIVIYCGCCPFDHCPNARPAIKLLKEMKFTNYQLLNLEHNIKIDWIDKGYPVMKQ